MIGWSKAREFDSQKYDNLLKLFEDCLVLCARQEEQKNSSSLTTSPDSSLVQICLSLYKNLILFEVAHGDVSKAVSLLQHIVSTCPSISELWILYARWVSTVSHAHHMTSYTCIQYTCTCMQRVCTCRYLRQMYIVNKPCPYTCSCASVDLLYTCTANMYMCPYC